MWGPGSRKREKAIARHHETKTENEGTAKGGEKLLITAPLYVRRAGSTSQPFKKEPGKKRQKQYLFREKLYRNCAEDRKKLTN